MNLGQDSNGSTLYLEKMPKSGRGIPSKVAAEGRRFPPGRAFVVQLSAADRSRKPKSGRVEHVLSGRSLQFESLEGLSEFFGAVLAEEDGGTDDGASE